MEVLHILIMIALVTTPLQLPPAVCLQQDAFEQEYVASVQQLSVSAHIKQCHSIGHGQMSGSCKMESHSSPEQRLTHVAPAGDCCLALWK